MGRTKALLPHPDGSGRSLVLAAAETLLAAGAAPLVVVVGHARRAVLSELHGVGEAIQPVANPAWRSGGMLSSLKAGIHALPQTGGSAWTLVAPVDQPFLSTDLIRRLLARACDPEGAAAGGSKGAAPKAVVPATPEMQRAGVWGLPVLLSHQLFPEILAESPPPGTAGADRGARRVLRRFRTEIALTPASPQELLDLDTLADYRNLTDALKKAPKGVPSGRLVARQIEKPLSEPNLSESDISAG